MRLGLLTGGGDCTGLTGAATPADAGPRPVDPDILDPAGVFPVDPQRGGPGRRPPS